MRIVPWNPWQEIENVRAKSDRIWNELFEKLRLHLNHDFAFIPEADAIETGNEYRLYLALPGLVEDDLDILLRDNELTVRGERFQPYDPDAAQQSSIECRYGFFERRFRFDSSVDAVRASYDAGILTIIVNKRSDDE